ncbi:MAG: type II toxin-antitoxin system VapC family toxin [Armatimonadota bacterium]
MNRKGCDSGFFLLLGTGHPLAQQVWYAAVTGNFELVMSTLSIHEVLVIHFRRGKTREANGFRKLIYSVPWLRVVPVSAKIAERSAGYKHGLGLSTVDSIILATAVEEGCDEILTTDRDFITAANQGIIKVHLLP